MHTVKMVYLLKLTVVGHDPDNDDGSFLTVCL